MIDNIEQRQAIYSIPKMFWKRVDFLFIELSSIYLYMQLSILYILFAHYVTAS